MNAWEERIYMEREARARGLAEGRAEGRAEAQFETMVENIKSLMDSLNLTQVQAMDALKIPREDRARYADKIK